MRAMSYEAKVVKKPHVAPANTNEPGHVFWDAGQLFRDRQVVIIEFRGERYQLRQTRNGKLILTK
jgi:hemin uptake protein HemP